MSETCWDFAQCVKVNLLPTSQLRYQKYRTTANAEQLFVGPKLEDAGVEGFSPQTDNSTGDQNLTATCSRGQQIKLTPNLCGLAGTFSGKPAQADFASSALLVSITT